MHYCYLCHLSRHTTSFLYSRIRSVRHALETPRGMPLLAAPPVPIVPCFPVMIPVLFRLPQQQTQSSPIRISTISYRKKKSFWDKLPRGTKNAQTFKVFQMWRRYNAATQYYGNWYCPTSGETYEQ